MSFNNVISADLIIKEDCSCCGEKYSTRIMHPTKGVDDYLICKFCKDADCEEYDECLVNDE